MNRQTLKFSQPILSLFLFATLLFCSSSAEAQLQKAVTLVKGSVSTAGGSVLPEASVTFLQGTEKVFSTKSNSEGKFTAVLKPGITYRMGVVHSGHLYKEEMLQLGAEEKNREVQVSLKPFTPNQPYEISEQVFAPQGTAILASAELSLSDIANTLRYNPKLQAEITVYPDAAPKSKKDLSQQNLVSGRSSAISSFLQSKGVPFKSFAVNQASTVPTKGQFPVRTAVSTKKKKGVTAMVPQYIEIKLKSSS